MILYLIRHGETEWNVQQKLQGHADIPLNEEGRRLARVTGEALQDIPFSRIYTSPLKRAKETALLVRGNRDIPLYEDSRIQEISFGIYEGFHCAKDHYDIPDPDFINFFHKPEAYIPPENAESIEELCERTTDFLQELVHNKELENETILVATHGAALRGILSSVDNNSKADFWHGGVHKNCAVTILQASAEGIQVLERAKTYYES